MKKYKSILIKGFIIVLVAARTKAIVFFSGYIIVLSICKIVNKIKVIYIVPFIPFFIDLSKGRINSEFLDSEAVRGVLYKTGWKIASDFWPLGSGFATFGSEFSRVNYSPLYYYYGISNKYGCSPDWPAYITDAHWASIIGEVGFIGLFIYGVICILMTYFLFNIYKDDVQIRIALCALWMYGLISSISDTILISYRGVAIIIITALFISILKSKHNILNYSALNDSDNALSEI